MRGANSDTGLPGQHMYVPVAVYYEDADMVEYVRQDVPCVNQSESGSLWMRPM